MGDCGDCTELCRGTVPGGDCTGLCQGIVVIVLNCAGGLCPGGIVLDCARGLCW